MVTRAEIVAEAWGWLGTRFHHQGRVKADGADRGGCDCIGLLVGVVRDLGIRDAGGKLLYEHDRADYGRIPDGALLQQMLGKHLIPKPVSDIEPGDILLFRFDQNPQHVAIVSDREGLGGRFQVSGSEEKAVRKEKAPASNKSTSPHEFPEGGNSTPPPGGSDNLRIIHCYAQARKVVEHGLDAQWRSRIVGAFTLFS